MVTVFGEVLGFGFALNFLGARGNGKREVINLHARVVVVELAHHLVALGGHHTRKNVTQSSLTGVPQMQGPCGIGRHIFEQNALAGKGGAFTEVFALGENVLDGGKRRFFIERQIDESGPRDFNGRQKRLTAGIVVKGRHEELRHFAGVFLQNLGALQRRGARKVAVGGVLGALQARGDALDTVGFEGIV